MAKEKTVRCYGCSCPVPTFAVDENGLCDVCVTEGELEVGSDLDDEEGEITQGGHRGETRDGCRACLALDEALVRLHGAMLCMSGKGHLTAADLLRDLGQLDGACAAVRRAAIIELTATAAAIAASGLVADAPVAAPEGDRLLSVKEAALRLGMSTGWLYRNADTLPFTVRTGPGGLRFSAAGITAYIRAKTAA